MLRSQLFLKLPDKPARIKAPIS